MSLAGRWAEPKGIVDLSRTSGAERTEVLSQSQIHEILLGILGVIVELLDTNEIEYFLIGGGCLGIARHSGRFVPWDDDLDIAVWAGDMPRLAEALNGLPKHTACKRKDDPQNPTLQVVDRRTRIAGHDPQDADGLCVDIVPMMHWSSRLSKRLDNVRSRLMGARHVAGQTRVSGLLKELIIRSRVRHLVPYILDPVCPPAARIEQDRKLRPARSGIVSGAMGRPWTGLYDSDVVYPLGRAEFCGMQVAVPRDLHRFLQTRYGANYMQAPPAKARWRHFAQAEWVGDQ